MKTFCTLILLCLTHFIYVFQTQRIENFSFVVKNKVIVDSLSKMYLNSEFEFSYQRIYLFDGTFKEKGLFERTSNFNVIQFKQINSDWYVKNNGIWDTFYTASKQVSPIVNFSDKEVQFVFIKKTELNGLACYIFKYKEIGKQTGGQLYYWFNPEKGIVLIKADDVELIRKDILLKN